MKGLLRRIALPCVLAASASATRAVDAQSLRGSRASVERMYRQARAEDLSFFKTARSVRRATSNGWLVRLTPEPTFRLHDVGFPYVRPATLTFVRRLSKQYHASCGDTLVVTSAVRPVVAQPSNSVAHSVHPTGMAVDLRKPVRETCVHWLRATLAALEAVGVIEATEEHAPAHFHVAVYPARYTRYVLRD